MIFIKHYTLLVETITVCFILSNCQVFTRKKKKKLFVVKIIRINYANNTAPVTSYRKNNSKNIKCRYIDVSIYLKVREGKLGVL